jgi:hypothetical protein
MTTVFQAIQDSRTVFTTKVKPLPTLPSEEVLKRGRTDSKIGRKVTKGKQKGFPIFALSLEERATCPKYCFHWDDCFGNNMRYGTRYVVSEELLELIYKQLQKIARLNPRGFMVRLHIVGDFESVEYVRFWRDMLLAFPMMEIFGYSARLASENDDIGFALLDLRNDQPRFHIRFSNDSNSGFAALSFDSPLGQESLAKGKGIICPEQLGKTDSCGTCRLCWILSGKDIIFLTH